MKNMTVNESVDKMIAAIKSTAVAADKLGNPDGSESASYMLGYLGSMMVSLAMQYPEVLKEVNDTTDWLEANL